MKVWLLREQADRRVERVGGFVFVLRCVLAVAPAVVDERDAFGG